MGFSRRSPLLLKYFSIKTVFLLTFIQYFVFQGCSGISRWRLKRPLSENSFETKLSNLISKEYLWENRLQKHFQVVMGRRLWRDYFLKTGPVLPNDIYGQCIYILATITLANHYHKIMMLSSLEIFKRVSMVMSLTHHYLHQERFHQDPEELAMNPMWKRLLKV